MSVKQIKGWTQVSEKRWVKGEVDLRRVQRFIDDMTNAGGLKAAVESAKEKFGLTNIQMQGQQVVSVS